jgi:recombination protein RecA
MPPRVLQWRDFVAPLSERPASASATSWGYAALAGRLAELSGTGASALLTAAFGLVLEAQQAGDPVAWVTSRTSSFFPPDAAEGGVDLDALAVVRAEDAVQAARAADQLLRSGGFGLVVLDLASNAGAEPRVPLPMQTRLAGLAQKHAAAVLALTAKGPDRPSLGSLVAVRAEATRGPGPTCEVRVIKDKRRGPGETRREACRAPAGVC